MKPAPARGPRGLAAGGKEAEWMVEGDAGVTGHTRGNTCFSGLRYPHVFTAAPGAPSRILSSSARTCQRTRTNCGAPASRHSARMQVDGKTVRLAYAGGPLQCSGRVAGRAGGRAIPLVHARGGSRCAAGERAPRFGGLAFRKRDRKSVV